MVESYTCLNFESKYYRACDQYCFDFGMYNNHYYYEFESYDCGCSDDKS
jgi:hypothetical protein